MSNKDKLYTITEKIQHLLNEVEVVADDVGDCAPSQKPKTKFLVCKNAWCFPSSSKVRYRIKDNSVVNPIQLFTNDYDYDTGVYLAQPSDVNKHNVFIVNEELVGVRDLLTHIIKKRGLE